VRIFEIASHVLPDVEGRILPVRATLCSTANSDRRRPFGVNLCRNQVFAEGPLMG